MTIGRIAFAAATTAALTVGLVAGAAVARTGGMQAAPADAWAPGGHGAVPAMDRLPPVASPSAALAASVRRGADVSGGNAEAALYSLRMLRSDVGTAHRDIYAYAPNGRGRALCFILEGRSGTCPLLGGSPTPGLDWSVSGGYSSKVDPAHADEPSALFGLASSRISSVAMISSGEVTPLQIVNNTFYVELDTTLDREWDVRLQVTYLNGSERTVAIPDPRS